MKNIPYICLVLIFTLLLNGCAFFNFKSSVAEEKNTTSLIAPEGETQKDLEIDTSSFKLPNIPEGIQGEDFKPLFAIDLLPYVVLFECEENEEIVKILQEKSVLLALQTKIPSDVFSLENRVLEDEAEAKKIMYSFGNYAPTIKSTVNYDTFPIIIRIKVEPNEPYSINKASIYYPELFVNSTFENEAFLPKDAPITLFDFGLTQGAIAKADDIQSAVDSIVPWFRDRGYPQAVVENAKYFAVESEKELQAEVYVNPKDYTRFGNISIKGSENLTLDYVDKIKSWEYGEAWNVSKVDELKEEILNIGAFSFVNLTASDGEQEGNIQDLTLTLTDGPPRTWGGGINYDTTRGFGFDLFWEHRNLFGEAEQLKFSGEYWLDYQEVTASFTKPDLFTKHQDFNTVFTFKSEITDAYDTTAGRLDVGFEQPYKLWNFKDFRISYYLQGEVGIEEDSSDRGKQEYYYFGMPLQINQINTDDFFDPSSGYTLSLKVAPYIGSYYEDFTLLRAELSFAKYFELMKNKKLILATRIKLGTSYPETSENVPSSLRFYSGGGNSVRGYGYQKIGPKDIHGDPIGGASLFEASLELRYKITQDIAIVPFFDMGNVYAESYPTTPLDLEFGTGIGLRYFTPIGPVRFDVAFPFEDKKVDFGGFQMYISIGQSF